LPLYSPRGAEAEITFTIHGLPPRSPEPVLAQCATHQHKYWPVWLAWAQQPILSRNPLDEVGKRQATRLANQPTILELVSPPLAVARGGEVPGRANHVTHPSPLSISSHQADVQIVEATASRSCTLPRVDAVLDITCTERPSVSAGQELSGHCLGTTSSHDHTSVGSTKQLFMRLVPHSPYMSTRRVCLGAVCSRTTALGHTSAYMRRGPNTSTAWAPGRSEE
jgi:hypothetical protein